MQFKYFAIPAIHPGSLEEELNRFLRGRRVLTVRHELVESEGTPYWVLFVEYLDGMVSPPGPRGSGAERVDYKQILSEPDFALFARLRELRKKIAQSESIPVYAIFTNEQLAEMAKRRPESMAGLGEIEGIGEARMEKYGAVFLRSIMEEKPESVKSDEESHPPF